MINTQYINLNMIPSGVMPVLYCSQYDIGRPLGVVVYNGSESVDLSSYTCTIEATRTDKTPVTAAVITSGNIGVFETTATMTNQADTYKGKLVLTDGNGKRVASLAFVLVVTVRTMDEDAEEIEEDASLYQQYTGTVQTIIASIRADLAAEASTRAAAVSAEAAARQSGDNTLQSNLNAEASTRASADALLQSQIDQLVAPSGEAPSAAEVENARIGADGVTYPTLGDAIRANDSLLKSAISDLTDDLATLANLAIFENGSITANNGTDVNSSARIRTKTYIDSRVIGAVAASGYEFNVYAYSGGTYIGCIQSDGSLGKTSSVKFVSKYIFSNEYDYRLVLKNISGTDITSEVFTNVYFLVPTDESLTYKYKSADAKIVGDKINSLQGEIIDTILGAEDIIVDSYSGTDWMELGAIDSSGTDVARSDSYRTDFLPCYSGSKIISSVTLTNTSGISWYHYICFYDSTKTFLSREGGSKDGTVTANTPEDAVYYRVTLTYVVAWNVATYSLTNTLDNANAVSPKTKWYVFGDSISAGYFSITDEEAEEKGYTITYRPAPSTGVTGVGSVWDSSLEHNYWGYANEWFLHKELIGKAYPGQGFFRVANNEKNGIMEVVAADVSDAGLITVAWGFNDWHYNLTRGNHDLIDASVPYPTAGYDTTQITTINQAIWFCLGELIRKAPLAKIVVQTPMNGWLYGGDFASNWGIGYSMSNSGTLAQIHDDIKYWADYYGLQVLEMTYNNSIVNRRNIQDALIDGSHPCDPAHQQLGRHVAIMLGYR